MKTSPYFQSFFTNHKLFIILQLLAISYGLQAQYTQLGNKLVGLGAANGSEGAHQGVAISLAANEQIFVVGAPNDNNGTGAIWTYTFSGNSWTQLGNKLVASGPIGSNEGNFVSLSGDGKMLAVGAPYDNNGVGAVYVFSLTGTNWTQVGNKLVGTGANNGTSSLGALQGFSVSISTDGNTLAAGGLNDSSGVGATWVYTFTGGNWTQIRKKIVGNSLQSTRSQGVATSLSSDGRTLAIGGQGGTWVYTFSNGNWIQMGNSPLGTGTGLTQGSVCLSSDGKTLSVAGTGSASVFTLSGGNWSQVGNSLVGTNANGNPGIVSLSLTSDGKTLAYGTAGDNSIEGCVWIFTFTGSNWAQVGNKIVGSGVYNGTYGSAQGSSVCLSSNGTTLIEGGANDSLGVGAVWIFNYTGNVTTEIANQEPIPSLKPKIFPNPFGRSINIQSKEEYEYTFYNAQGIAIESGNSSSASIGLQLSPGIYLLKVNNDISKVVKVLD